MSPPRVGTIVDGRYRLERELGSGAMGVVYEALDLGLDRRVALKVVDAVGVEDGVLRRHFQREARALARIEHEHVVRIHELGTHGPALFFAMELIRGRTLAEVLDAAPARQIPLSTALQLLDGVADGLDAVHRARLVHRDVKPANVVVERGTERPVLVDFGLALELRDAGQTHRGGTPEYMAPELSAGNPASQASDVYAFACTAFEVLTGRLPFSAPTVEELFALHAAGRVPSASTVRHALVGADAALRRGLSKDPGLRPVSCRSLVADIRSGLEPSAVSIRVPAARIPSAPPSSSSSSHDGRVLILVLDEDVSFARACGRAAGAVFVGACHLVVGATLHGAASRLGERGPHLAIVDLDDPGGIDAIAALRVMPGGDRTVMVGITAAAKPPHEPRLAQLGVLDVLHKPIAFEDLVAGLRLVARRRRLRTPPVPPACGAPIV